MTRLSATKAVILSATALGCSLAGAQSMEDLRRCAALQTDEERLACFDRTMGTPAPSENDSPATAPERDPSDTPEPESGGDVNPERIVKDAPPTRPQQEVDTRKAVIEDFGLPEEKEPPPSRPPEELTAVVKSVSRLPRGRHRVVLENGQIWQQEFASRYFPVKAGDTVIIEERMLSGYRLVTPSGKGYGVERIR